MEFKSNIVVENKRVAKELLSKMIDYNIATIYNDEKLVWCDNKNSDIKTKNDKGVQLISPQIEIDDIAIYEDLINFLQKSGSNVFGKITVVDYKTDKKNIRSYDFEKDEEYNFEKPLTKQDITKMYEKKIDNQINNLFESLDKDSVKEDYLSIVRNSLNLYNYSVLNVMLVSLEANNRGKSIEKIASLKKWSNVQTKGHVKIEQTDNNDILSTLSLETGKHFVLKINDEKEKLFFNAEEYSYNDFVENKKLISIENNNTPKAEEAIANFLYKTVQNMIEEEELEKDVKVGVSVLKGSKSYPIFVPVIKKEKIEEPVYEVDDNGEIVKDLDGKPIQKIDKDGNPIYKVVERSRLNGFTTGSVFDVNQTNAKELGLYEPPMEKLMQMHKSKHNITDENYNDIVKKIEDKYNLEILETNIEGSNSAGVFYPSSNKIVINANLHKTNETKLSTLFHELGHALMHGFKSDEEYNNIHKKDTTQKEIEAETFAYMLYSQFGLEARSDIYIYSFLQTVEKKNRKQFLFKLVDGVRQVAQNTISKLDLNKNIINCLNYNKKEILKDKKSKKYNKNNTLS